DRPNTNDRAPSGPSGGQDRTGVFQRNPDGGIPDRLDSLYRPEPSARSASEGSATRRMPRAGDGTPPRRPSRDRGRDGTGRERRERGRRAGRRRNAADVVQVMLVVLPTVGYFCANSRLRRVETLVAYEGRPEEQPGSSYLIVGSESRGGLSEEDSYELRTGS